MRACASLMTLTPLNNCKPFQLKGWRIRVPGANLDPDAPHIRTNATSRNNDADGCTAEPPAAMAAEKGEGDGGGGAGGAGGAGAQGGGGAGVAASADVTSTPVPVRAGASEEWNSIPSVSLVLETPCKDGAGDEGQEPGPGSGGVGGCGKRFCRKCRQVHHYRSRCPYPAQACEASESVATEEQGRTEQDTADARKGQVDELPSPANVGAYTNEPRLALDKSKPAQQGFGPGCVDDQGTDPEGQQTKEAEDVTDKGPETESTRSPKS